MSDLLDKLNRLDKTSYRQQDSDNSEHPAMEAWIQDFESELNASIVRERSSFIILKENIFPFHRHPLSEFFRANGGFLNSIHYITAEDRVRDWNLRKTVFIDLETTGLAGGTGTFAFLVGIGHIELDHFVVRQYLLPDFQYEWLLLKQVENVLSGAEFLVSFNGKSFDVPLLKNRFVLNRMETGVDDLIHIDILHPARRLWSRRLASCDLVNLEFSILGEERIHDIPGELIPQIFFEYIRKRQAVLMRDVLEHNYYDIAHMMLLTLEIGRQAADPIANCRFEEDLFSIARYYYRSGYFEKSLPLFEHLYQSAGNEQLKKESLFMLSMIHKKSGNLESSRQLFHLLLNAQKDHAAAIEELAKYYEHHEKNYQSAVELIDRSLEYSLFLKQLGKDSTLDEIRDDLIFRRNRLVRKMKRSRNNSE